MKLVLNFVSSDNIYIEFSFLPSESNFIASNEIKINIEFHHFYHLSWVDWRNLMWQNSMWIIIGNNKFDVNVLSMFHSMWLQVTFDVKLFYVWPLTTNIRIRKTCAQSLAKLCKLCHKNLLIFCHNFSQLCTIAVHKFAVPLIVWYKLFNNIFKSSPNSNGFLKVLPIAMSACVFHKQAPSNPFLVLYIFLLNKTC